MMPKSRSKNATRHRCERCHDERREHRDGKCPDGQGVFTRRPHPREKPFASQSFSAEEVGALATTLMAIQNGAKPADLAVLVRHPVFQNVVVKVKKMQMRVDEWKKEIGDYQ